MPIVRITMTAGKSAEYLKAVSESIYTAMREQYVLDENDLFHIFEQLTPGSFIYDRRYGVEEARTDDFIMVRITSDARRNDEKTATIKAISDNLASSPGLKRQDVVVVFESNFTLEDFSLGNGISVANQDSKPPNGQN